MVPLWMQLGVAVSVGKCGGAPSCWSFVPMILVQCEVDPKSGGV
jgi:hypothetical protein